MDSETRVQWMQHLMQEELYAPILQQFNDNPECREQVRQGKTYRLKRGSLCIHVVDATFHRGPCRQLVLELPAAAQYTARWCCTADVARVTSLLLGWFELLLLSVVSADGQKVTSQFAHGPMSKQSSSAEADASVFTSSQSSLSRKKRMSYNVHSFTA
ncbi:MAG: hypothetical protein OIF58_04865, partial [Cohaesibacter sp.]|nr:hypothetical protein [Cohaesibacter sp.]